MIEFPWIDIQQFSPLRMPLCSSSAGVPDRRFGEDLAYRMSSPCMRPKLQGCIQEGKNE